MVKGFGIRIMRGADDRLAAVDFSFCVESPFLGVASSSERVAETAPFASDLDPPIAGSKL